MGRLFLTGVPSMMNICVALESTIATCVDAGIAAWAKLMVLGGEITVGEEMLEATIVTSSSGSKAASIHIWVGYDESVTQTFPSFTFVFAAPNRHMAGN